MPMNENTLLGVDKSSGNSGSGNPTFILSPKYSETLFHSELIIGECLPHLFHEGLPADMFSLPFTT